MAVVSDRTYRKWLSRPSHAFDVDPIDIDSQIQPGSIDLTIGSELYDVSMDEFIECDDELVFPPFRFFLASTRERITMPRTHGGKIEGRSSIGRLGLQIHNAGWVDPGFSGYITLELFNFCGTPVVLPAGTRICQLTSIEMDQPVDSSYAEKGDAKYQDQSGPTPSRFEGL